MKHIYPLPPWQASSFVSLYDFGKKRWAESCWASGDLKGSWTTPSGFPIRRVCVCVCVCVCVWLFSETTRTSRCVQNKSNIVFHASVSQTSCEFKWKQLQWNDGWDWRCTDVAAVQVWRFAGCVILWCSCVCCVEIMVLWSPSLCWTWETNRNEMFTSETSLSPQPFLGLVFSLGFCCTLHLRHFLFSNRQIRSWCEAGV